MIRSFSRSLQQIEISSPEKEIHLVDLMEGRDSVKRSALSVKRFISLHFVII